MKHRVHVIVIMATAVEVEVDGSEAPVVEVDAVPPEVKEVKESAPSDAEPPTVRSPRAPRTLRGPFGVGEEVRRDS